MDTAFVEKAVEKFNLDKAVTMLKLLPMMQTVITQATKSHI